MHVGLATRVFRPIRTRLEYIVLFCKYRIFDELQDG